MNPFNFRLGLINGTVVKPDARDWAARTVATGPLLLFLPATGHVPDNYRKFLTVAAESGYHVLGLDFWNRGDAVANICGVDARCYTQVQRNRFNGTRPSEFSKVDEANSVLSRLQAALDYLTVHDPDGGWGQYTHDEQIDWDNIVVSGHSQGGGEAAYIAHKFRVMGQITFSSPIITDKDHAASWLKTKGKTPTSVMYAFDDSHDEFYPRIIHSWRELHLPGRVLTARVPVPTASDPAHQLVSNRELGNPRLAHLRSVIDFTPVNKKGVPVFEPVWKWMLNQVYKDPESIEATAGGQ
jgi:dienelactone hydrolase